MTYYNYRYYNSIDGRWLSRDPKTIDNKILYQYALNSPVYQVDYLGLLHVNSSLSGSYTIAAGPLFPGAGWILKASFSANHYLCYNCKSCKHEQWTDFEIGISLSAISGGAFKGLEKAPNGRGTKYRSRTKKGNLKPYRKGPKKGDRKIKAGREIALPCVNKCPESSGVSESVFGFISGTVGAGYGFEFRVTFPIYPELRWPKWDDDYQINPGFYAGIMIEAGAQGSITLSLRDGDAVTLF